MTRFFTPRASAGRMRRRRFSGMARFSESFLVWRKPLLTSPDNSRRRSGGVRGPLSGPVRAVRGLESGSEQRSLLQFIGGDVLLVRGFVDCVGSFGRRRNLLVSFALVLCRDHSFCRRDRLPSQLAEESLVSLRDHRTTVPHRRDSFSG